MSHDTERTLGTYGTPGGGLLELVDVSPGGVVPRVRLLHRNVLDQQDLDPAAAGLLGEDLLAWAIDHGKMPRPSTQIARWQLPDANLLAVLIERATIGEEPTVENLERFTAAYREAHRIARALPEVLGLLEQLNPDDGVVDAEIACGPECSEGHTYEVGRCEQAIAPRLTDDGYSGPTHPTDRWQDTPTGDRLYGLLHGARENLCRAQHHVASKDNGRALDQAVALIDRVGHLLEQWSEHDRADLLADLPVDWSLPEDNPGSTVFHIGTLGGMLEHLVNQWGALGVARKLHDGVPADDREAWLRAVARPDEDATRDPLLSDWQTDPEPVRGYDEASDLAEALRLTAEWAQAIALPGWSWFDALNRYRAARGLDPLEATGLPCGVTAGQTSGPWTAPVVPPTIPRVADVSLVLDVLAACLGGSIADRPDVVDAILRLRSATVAAIRARDELLHVDLDPLELVEDEDGAPLPESVQVLIASARRVVDQSKVTPSVDLRDAIDGLAVSVARVRREARRGDPVDLPPMALVDRGDLMELLDTLGRNVGHEDLATNVAHVVARLLRQVQA